MTRFEKFGPIGLLIVLGYLLAGCDIFERWDGLVYPLKANRENSIDIGTYSSLKECREAALAKLAQLQIHKEIGGYICGKNCLVESGFTNARMCAQTSR